MKNKLKLALTLSLIAPLLSGCLNFNQNTSSEDSTSESFSSEKITSEEASLSASSSNSFNATSEVYSSEESISSEISNGEEKVLVLDSTNKPTALDNYENLKSAVDEITFEYNKAKNSLGHVFLGKTGSITNAEETNLGNIKSFTINYDVVNNSDDTLQNLSGFGYLKYRTSNNYIDNVNDYSVDIKVIGQDYKVSFNWNNC